MSDFVNAVNGWLQCAKLLDDTTAKLEWALLQIKLAKPGAFRQSADGAKNYVEAERVLRSAKAYSAAQKRALVGVQSAPIGRGS